MSRKRFSMLLVGAMLVAAMFGFLWVVPDASAQDALANLTSVQEGTGLGTTDIRIVIARVVRILLGFVGIIATLLVMWGGYLWMTASGEPSKVQKAQKILINAGIGLVIILSALVITQFVLNQLAAATGYGTGTSEGAPLLITPLSSALGNGIIETHYPRRSQAGVARNTNIVVTFREAIDPATVLAGYDATTPVASYALNTGAVKIYPSDDGVTATLASNQVAASITADFKTFVFNPVPLLGNAETNVWYTVSLTDDIELATGESAFTGAFDGYEWRFQVSTEVDLTPPRVESVVPVASSTVARNILVQVQYNEAVNPISASGASPVPFSNLQVSAVAAVAGTWNSVNNYTMSEFVSDVACGTNSCGETIYCLPPTALVNVLVKAANLVEAGSPEAVFPYTGVVDMAGNSLDGDSDGVAEGPNADHYSWTFNTTNATVLDPPQIVSATPALVAAIPASSIPFDQAVRVRFNSMLSGSTVNADNVILHSPSESLWFNSQVGVPVEAPGTHEITLQHGLFSADRLYGAEVTSGLRSVYQNCYTPSASATCSGPNCCNENGQAAACVYPEFAL